MFKQNLNALNEQQQKDFYQAIPSRYPLGRLGEPCDVAQMALFLCSPLSSWVTGSIIAVDGGLTTQ
jgi:Tropinone reductase 1